MEINKAFFRKWKVPIAIAAVIIFLMLFSGPGCGNQWMLFYDRPIKGHVVDAETGKPLEGVLVVGMWQLSQFLSQGFGGYAKVIVAQTDREGKFKIPFWVALKPWKVCSAMRDGAPSIMLYKPGYRFSRKILLERISQYTILPERKKMVEEINSLMPAKLKKAYRDEDIWKNFGVFESRADFSSRFYSKKQIKEILNMLEKETLKMSETNNKSKRMMLQDINEYRKHWVEGKK